MTLNGECSGHCIHQSLGGYCCVGDVFYVSQHDQEFVASETGDGVLVTCPCLKSFGNFLQEEVASRVPQRIVDVLELVEVEEQKCDFLLLPTSASQCLRQPILKKGSIG